MKPRLRVATTEIRKARCQRRGAWSISGANHPVSIRALISATLAVALLSASVAQSGRDSRSPSAPPPIVSQTIAAKRGEKVQVPLGIHGTRGEMLEFFIRTPPAHGKLSPVTSTGMNAATVIYTPGRGTPAEDRFAYAVRGSEGVSAPGAITIRFVDPVVAAPKLKSPTELEFPPVFPGQRSTVEMELTNDGGGILEGEVAVQEPWSIEGLKYFRIAAGKRATVRLVFIPAQAGVRTGEAIISGTERKIIPLRASAEARLAATPAQLKLTAQPGNQTRMGMMKIANRTDEEATVAVEAGARLLTDRMIKVPARGTSTVPVFADAAVGAAFDDMVKLSSREWNATIAVHAVAVGAILKFAANEVTITGNARGATPRGIATLENTGGEAVTVRLDVAPPFDVETRVVTAPPRGSVEIPIHVRDAAAGIFHASLKASGEGGSAIVPVKAEIGEPAPPRTSAPPIAVAAEDSADIKPGQDKPQDDSMPLIPLNVREIPNALGTFVRSVEKDTASLEWPANLGPVEGARIEERVLSLSGNDELQIAWAPLADATITPAGPRISAELRGLKPGTLYTVRAVTGKDADVTVLFTSDFRTAPKKPIFTSAMRTPLLGLALVVLLFAVWRARHPKKSAKP
jgi:hypothetical protein